MSTEIGAFEAKTKFSEILRKVSQGERFTVTLRGRVVAVIAPPESGLPPVPPEVLDRLKHPRIHGVGAAEIRAAIEEGRR